MSYTQTMLPGMPEPVVQHEEDTLPSSYVELVDALGETVALALVQRIGGVRVYVPSGGLGADHWLTRTLPPEVLEALYRSGLAGDTISIPRLTRRMLAERNRNIRNKYDQGTSVRTLALTHHLTERQISTILGGV